MVKAEELLGLLPPYENNQLLINSRQDVPDIINEVLDAHEIFASDYDRIVQYFYYGNLLDFCKTLFKFCKENIAYKIEKEEKQTTKSPGALLTMGQGDCKHYAGFIAGNLQALERLTNKKINWCYRFASYSIFDSMPSHVFVVVVIGGIEYWLDPVLNDFNSRYVIPISFIDETFKNFSMDNKKNSVIGLLQFDAPTITGEQPVGISSQAVAYSKPEMQANAATTIIELPDYIKNFSPEPTDLTPEIQDALQQLFYYGIFDSNMNFREDIFTQTLASLDLSDAEDLLNSYGKFLTESNSIGGIFGDAWNVAKKITLAPARAAFLALMGINFFGLATHFFNMLNDPSTNTNYNDISAIWADKLRGDMTLFRASAILGNARKAILGDVPPPVMGVTDLTLAGAVAAAAPTPGLNVTVALCASIIAALLPLINAFIKKQSTPIFTYPAGTISTGGGTGVNSLEKYLPLLVVGVGAYFILSKKKK